MRTVYYFYIVLRLTLGFLDMDGIPWELDNFAPRYPGSPPNNNNMRIPTRKGVPAPLDTISERPRLPVPTSPPPRLNGSSASATVAKVYRCQDAATSTTDLDGEPSPSLSDLTSPKKVQKGQINALAKMLSALKTNRSGRE